MRFLILFFSVLFVLIIKPDKYSDFSSGYNLILILYYFLVLSVFLILRKNIEKGSVSFDVFFLIGYTIVHFQIPFLASLGIEPARPEHIWLNKEVVNYATWMSTVAIFLWFIGYSLVMKNIKQNAVEMFRPKKWNYILHDFLLILTFLGFLVLVGQNFLQGAYSVKNWGSGANYFLIIFQGLIYLRIIYFFSGIEKESNLKKVILYAFKNKIFITLLLVYFLLFISTGSRGEILKILLLIAFCYSFYVKKLSFKFLIIVILIGSFVFTIMGMGRERVANELGNEGVFQRGYYVLQEEGFRIPTNELASSVRIQYRAIDYFPDNNGYLFGVTYIKDVASTIPFLNTVFKKITDIPYYYLSSAELFTFIGQGLNSNYGEGTEILSDIYINFGISGVFLIMFAFGALIGLLRKKILQGSFLSLLIYAMFFMNAIYLNRSYLMGLYKPIIYIVAFHYFFVFLNSTRKYSLIKN